MIKTACSLHVLLDNPLGSFFVLLFVLGSQPCQCLPKPEDQGAIEKKAKSGREGNSHQSYVKGLSVVIGAGMHPNKTKWVSGVHRTRNKRKVFTVILQAKPRNGRG